MEFLSTDTLLPLVLVLVVSVAFYELFVALRLNDDVKAIMVAAPAAAQTVGSKTLTDRQKERAMRQMSVAVFKSTGLFLVKLALILCVATGILFVGSLVLPGSFAEILAFSVSWLALGVVLVFILAYGWLRNGRD